MKGHNNKKHQKGSSRISAWVYAVINPIIEALRIEKNFLKDKNWTWRYSSGAPEFIRPLQFYLDQSTWPNLEDFLRVNSKFNKYFHEHDQLLEKLTVHCLKAFESLVLSESFKQRVHGLLSEYMGGKKDIGYPGGAVPEKDFPKLVAQYVINNIKELPEFYTMWKFWGRFGEEFLHFRTGVIFQKVDETGEHLEQYDEVLIKKMENLRFEFCQKYDIPAAPIPYIHQTG